MQYMIQQLQYNTHLILNSKYRLIIHFFIVFLIYLSLYGSKIVFCSNDGQDIPVKAESKTATNHENLSPTARYYKERFEAYKQLYLQAEDKIDRAKAESKEMAREFKEYKTNTEAALAKERNNTVNRLIHLVSRHGRREHHHRFFESLLQERHGISLDRVREDLTELKDIIVHGRAELSAKQQALEEAERVNVYLRDQIEVLGNQIETKDQVIQQLRQRNIELQNTIPLGSRTIQRPIAPLNPTDEEVKSMKEELLSTTKQKKNNVDT